MTWKIFFGISEKLSVKVERGLLNVEDWKLLFTTKKLFSTSLILRLIQNKNKKEIKSKILLSGYLCCFIQRFTNFSFSFVIVIVNMSTAKRTSIEIVKALTEEISDEKGKPHSKKPR